MLKKMKSKDSTTRKKQKKKQRFNKDELDGEVNLLLYKR